MSYASTYDVAVDPDHVFRKQVAGALHSIAVDVVSEDPATENHAERLTWARSVLNSNDGPVVESGRWIWLMLTNSTFAADPLNADDGAVKTVASGHLNTMLQRWYI